MTDYDAVIFPGGFGAVTNWCNWLMQARTLPLSLKSELVNLAKEHNLPMGFICIAPVMIAKLFSNPTLTIGNDKDIAQKLESMGATHVECPATEAVIDENNNIVSTPANMLASNLIELHAGIHQLIKMSIIMQKNRSK